MENGAGDGEGGVVSVLAADPAELIRIWRDEPGVFIRQVLGAQPYAWQDEVIEAYRVQDRVSIRSGHGVGKTSLLSWLILHFLGTRKEVKIPCTAGTATQLQDILWPEIAKWVRNIPEEYRAIIPYEVKSDSVVIEGLDDLNFASARTARREQPDALQGYHAENLLFVIDEASAVPDEVFNVAEGALSGEGAKVIMTGNPIRGEGYFYDSFHRDRGRWWTKRVSCADSPSVSRTYIEGMKAKWGEDSNEFRIRVSGEFPLEGNEDRIIPLGMIESAVGRPVEANQAAPMLWGVDVARLGGDRCALAKRKGVIVPEKVKWWSGKTTDWTIGRIIEEFEDARDKPSEIYIDAIGFGATIYDVLRARGYPVRGVNVAEMSSNKKQYHRLRDELWFKGREWFESLQVSIPDDRDLIAELSSVSYELRLTGARAVKDKKEIGWSPDIADAFLLTFAYWNARHGRDMVYSRVQTPQYAVCSASYIGDL